MKFRSSLENELHSQMNEDYADLYDGKLCKFFNISKDMRNNLTEHQMDEYRNKLWDILIDATDKEFKVIWIKYLPNIDIDKVIVIYEQVYGIEYVEKEDDWLSISYEDSKWYSKVQKVL